MGRQWDEKSTNVRIETPESPFWDLLADWTVGDIPTPLYAEDLEPCPSCGRSVVARDGRCEQCALEHELFHREERLVGNL